MRIEALLKSYPHGRPSDVEVYSLNVCFVLLNFPQPVIDYVTAPGTGIQAQSGRRFLPTPGEVREACEDALSMFQRAFEHKPDHAEQRRLEIEAEKRERAERKSYDELRAKYPPNWGLQTAADVDREERRRAKIRQDDLDRQNEIAAEWDRRGVEAPMIAGIKVSPELAAHLSLATPNKAEGGSDEGH